MKTRRHETRAVSRGGCLETGRCGRVFESTRSRRRHGAPYCMPSTGGQSRQGRGYRKAGAIYIGGYEMVRSRKVAFAFSTGDITRGCINVHLLVVPSVGLAVVRAKRPVSKDLMAKGLKISFVFPYRTGDAFPVSLM